MSSRTAQAYTRRLANETGMPIFCIDYRKAPDFPYPNGLNDIWQAYLWIINVAP
jgi:hormone-sensitive lipase